MLTDEGESGGSAEPPLFVFFALLQSLICFFMQRLYKNEQNTEKQGFKHLTLKIKYGKIV